MLSEGFEFSSLTHKALLEGQYSNSSLFNLFPLFWALESMLELELSSKHSCTFLLHFFFNSLNFFCFFVAIMSFQSTRVKRRNSHLGPVKNSSNFKTWQVGQPFQRRGTWTLLCILVNILEFYTAFYVKYQQSVPFHCLLAQIFYSDANRRGRE